MSDQIPVGHAQQYRSNVELLLQQMGSKLEYACAADTAYGKGAKLIEQVGAVEPRERTARHMDTPQIDTPHAARWAHPRDFDWGDLIDDPDKVRAIASFESPYAKAGAMSLGRGKDKAILQAFFATAKVGADGTTDEAWDTDYDVAVGTSGMTVEKLRLARKLLEEADADLDNDPAYCALGPKEHYDLLTETQAISLDYTDKPVLVDGKIQHFMGFDFIITNLVTKYLHTVSTDIATCPCWVKSGLVLATWEDIITRIGERPDKSYSTGVYVRATYGATRTEIGKVVKISCDRSP